MHSSAGVRLQQKGKHKGWSGGDELEGQGTADKQKWESVPSRSAEMFLPGKNYVPGIALKPLMLLFVLTATLRDNYHPIPFYRQRN